MQDLDTLLAATKAVHDYFGYVEDWVTIPIDDGREFFWVFHPEWSPAGKAANPVFQHRYDTNPDEDMRICGGDLIFHEDREVVENQDGDHYCNVLYTQRFLPKWVFRGPEYTMFSVDTRTDGNTFLMIVTNANEVT